MSFEAFNCPALNRYLEYVEDTESPRIFHLWALIAGAGACMGRRVWLPFGPDQIYPNSYVVFVGPPAIRKSTAIKYIAKMIRESTEVKFAPKDTGGQRQGLITALEGNKESIDGTEAELEQAGGLTVESLAQMKITVQPENAHVMFALASEFNSLIGKRSTEMLTFLQEMYDGEPYDYSLRKEQQVLKEPLLSILGATTPTALKAALPEEAEGQGFMSRIIFVFGSQKYKRIARPKPPPEHLGEHIKQILANTFYSLSGPMKESPEAEELFDELYDKDIALNDVRFVHYKDRRQTHLVKTSMCIAALRNDMTISVRDIQDAQRLLEVTEQFMPDALGEYGMSPLAVTKQRIVEFLQSVKEPVTPTVLYAMFNRDIKTSDFVMTMNDLINSGKVKQVELGDGEQAYISAIAQKELNVGIELEIIAGGKA